MTSDNCDEQIKMAIKGSDFQNDSSGINRQGHQRQGQGNSQGVFNFIKKLGTNHIVRLVSWEASVSLHPY